MAGELRTSVILELVDKITAPTRRITQALAGLSRRGGLENLKNAGRQASTALGDTIKRAAALGKGLAIVGGAAAAAGWAVTRMVGGVATLGNEIKIAAERLGVGARWLQEWQYAAHQFGVGNDALIDGLKELGLRADEFVMTGSGGAAEAFERLGITVKDLRGTAGETEKLLDLVLSRMGKIQNDAAKQRIFDELFGGSGGEQMVALLTQSREELDKLRQAARDNGAILSDEDIEQSRLYVRQMHELTSTLAGLKNTILGSLLPTVNQWLGGISKLSKANREMVTQQVLMRLRQLWTGLSAVGTTVTWVADLVGGFGPLIAIVSTLIAGKFLLSLVVSTVALVKLGWSFSLLAVKFLPAVIGAFKAFSLALLTTPIGWIILGITALAGAAYLIYRNWDGIADWFSGMWDRVKAFFDRGIGDIAKDLLAFSPARLLMSAVDAVFELLGARPLSDLGREWIGGLANGIAERFEQLTGWLRQKVGALTGWLPDWMTGGGLTQGFAAPAGAAAAAPKLGPPAFSNRPTPLVHQGRADVGGELRIKIDQEGRARVASMKANGGLDYSVESGLLGVVQ
ncbi:hypothetical protein CDR19_09465 [Ectopseudomonas toyotomiensis]|uniref:Phage tail tape measure protein n=1 Tax=Ectopseudomonas toyotomiensis TaxID=554344 RepID=A0A1I5PDZ9_9GAMM|nr:hypothetical protein [Pseudomonas toyotomiensis]PIA73641.1 hypothetical protein CDR19_09465 [Pseudomonas toyotomiensis]SFP32328.1 hypothetical protein SAMN05216177_102273 [Pseudomonas toyotomiensis]